MPTGCTQQNRKLSTRLSTDCGYVDYGYKISCGKHKNRTDICTRAADSVDKLWINRKSAHGRHGQRQTGKPRQSGIFPEKTAKIIDFRVDEMGVYEYN